MTVTETQVDELFDELVKDNKLLYLTRKAERGDVQSQYELGYEYESGKNITKDWNLAVKWYRKAAKQGHIEAQIELGEMYFFGINVSKSNKKAFYWYLKIFLNKEEYKSQNHEGSNNAIKKIAVERLQYIASLYNKNFQSIISKIMS